MEHARAKFVDQLREATLAARSLDDPVLQEARKQLLEGPRRWTEYDASDSHSARMAAEARALLALVSHLIRLKLADEKANFDEPASWGDVRLAGSNC